MDNTQTYDKIYAMLEQGYTPEQIVESLNKAEKKYKDEQKKKEKEALKEKQRQTKIDCARKILVNSIDNYVRAITDEPISAERIEELDKTFKQMEKIIKEGFILPTEWYNWF